MGNVRSLFNKKNIPKDIELKNTNEIFDRTIRINNVFKDFSKITKKEIKLSKKDLVNMYIYDEKARIKSQIEFLRERETYKENIKKSGKDIDVALEEFSKQETKKLELNVKAMLKGENENIIVDMTNLVNNENIVNIQLTNDLIDKIKIIFKDEKISKILNDQIKGGKIYQIDKLDIIKRWFNDPDHVYTSYDLEKINSFITDIISIQNYELNKLLKNNTKIALYSVAGITALITLYFIIKPYLNTSINTTTPSINTSKTPNTTYTPNNNSYITPKGLEILKLIISEKISGCYIFTNNNGILTSKRLEGCSEWYNNIENQLNCRCSTITEQKTISDCNNIDDCNLPFCLGKNNCKEPDKKCKTDDNQILYMCNGDNIDKKDFVFYAYQYFPPDMVTAVITELYYNEENTSNNIKKIVFSIIFIIIIILIIYIIMNSKKRKLKK
jgi:hypothetical protein